MSESMIERVAKALFKFEGDGSDFHKISAVQRDYWLGAARTAIEAMREPTEDMIEMGFIRPPQWDHDSATVLDVYQAMIDTALKVS